MQTSAIHQTLSDAQTADQWTTGDVINLLPGTYNTGFLILNSERLVFNCADCVLYAYGVAPTQYPLEVRRSGIVVSGPATLRNTGPAGGVLRLLALEADLRDVMVRDIRIDQTNTTAINPIAVSQTSAIHGGHIVYNVVLQNVVLDAGPGLPDGFSFGLYPDLSSPQTSRYGCAYAINCSARGCTQAPNSNGLSCDVRMLCVVDGGTYTESGGPTITTAPNLGGRLFVFNADLSRGALHPNAAGLPAEAIAEWVEGCYIHDAWNGVLLQTAYSPHSGIGICRSNVIIRDPTRRPEGGYGVRSLIKNAIIEDCVIEGWNKFEMGGYGHDAAVYNGPAANGTSMLMRRCWIKDAYRGIESYYYEAMIDVQDCLFTMSPGIGGLALPAAVKVTSSTGSPGQLRMANNVIAWAPTQTVGNVIYTAGVQRDRIGGGNYIWTNGNANPDLEWQRYPTDITAAGEPARPLFDACGHQLPTSPALAATCINTWAGQLNPGHGLGRYAVQSAQSRDLLVLDAAVDPSAINQTVHFGPSVNWGQWRRIESISGNIITVVPPLEVIPYAGEMLDIKNPVLPSAGSDRLWDAAYFGFDTTLDHDLYQDCNTNGIRDNSLCEPDGDGDNRIDACDACPHVLAGDVNLDGAVNALDIPEFVARLVSGEFRCEADVDSSGIVDSHDIQPFLIRVW